LSEKNEVIYRDRGYFGPKLKGCDSIMRKVVKEYSLEMSDVFRNKRVRSKRAPRKEFPQ
jgi:IS5 family transposase